MLSALTECCFGEMLGASLDLSSLKWENLWSETNSCFIVSVAPERQKAFEVHFAGLFTNLGEVTSKKTLAWKFQNENHEEPLETFLKEWSEGVMNVYQA